MAKQRDHTAMEQRRLKAAGYFEEGKSASEVAKLLGVRRQSAHAWLQVWRKTGVKGLASKGPEGAAGKAERGQLWGLG